METDLTHSCRNSNKGIPLLSIIPSSRNTRSVARLRAADLVTRLFNQILSKILGNVGVFTNKAAPTMAVLTSQFHPWAA